jgi:hypothetical protein
LKFIHKAKHEVFKDFESDPFFGHSIYDALSERVGLWTFFIFVGAFWIYSPISLLSIDTSSPLAKKDNATPPRD